MAEIRARQGRLDEAVTLAGEAARLLPRDEGMRDRLRAFTAARDSAAARGGAGGTTGKGDRKK